MTDFGAKPDDDGLQTAAIQAAIDAAADQGGGTIRFPKGRFASGAIRLRDNIRLLLEEGAVLRGSANWRDFGQGEWLDALITARDARGIRIEGPGRIDGADCENPKGDDCLAGCDNIDFEILDCRINSSCNGFRLGCVNLVVRKCEFWGPGEHPHWISVRRGSPRTNMLAAF